MAMMQSGVAASKVLVLVAGADGNFDAAQAYHLLTSNPNFTTDAASENCVEIGSISKVWTKNGSYHVKLKSALCRKGKLFLYYIAYECRCIAGHGLTGSIVLKSGQLSDLISQLQVLIKGVNESEISPEMFDSKMLAAQIQKLAKEIREYAGSRPITIVNESSSSNGTYSSYVLPAAALGAAGYCYMWWKGWSLADVMFVTKHNMENAVATVSKKLEHVSEALTSTRKHLSKKLENLDWKLDEQMETSKLIANDVTEVRTNLNQIGYDIETIQQLVFGLEGKLELLESKQDVTNTGLWYLCQVAGGTKNEIAAKPVQDVGTKLLPTSTNENVVKGLQFLVDSDKQKPVINSSKKINASGNGPLLRTRFNRSYPIGMSFPLDGLGSGS